MDLDVALKVLPARRVGEDRAMAFKVPGGRVFALADGAGGTSGGGFAADSVVARVSASAPSTGLGCVAILQAVDRDLAALGQTTAIVLGLINGVVFGASVGDSSAWLMDGGVLDLTAHQRSKPLLGSRMAVVIPFGPFDFKGRLLLGSDGLFKYVAPGRIYDIATSEPLTDVPDALIAAARLPSGAWQDDISVIIAEQRY